MGSVGAFQTWREMGLVRLTLWVVKSKVVGLPLRKGPAWRSTRSERGFVYFGGLGIGGFCGFELFCFLSDFQEIFCFKGCSCFLHEKYRKLLGQDPR